MPAKLAKATGARSIPRGVQARICSSFGPPIELTSCLRCGTPPNADPARLRTVSERLLCHSVFMENVMNQEAVSQFKGQLRGELIEPGDASYEEARKVYNAMISRRPRMIAKCTDVADVINAVNFARRHNL